MRTKGTPQELERRRCLAVQRVEDGYTAEEVADFLGIDPSSVRRWVAAFRRHGPAGLAARAAPGRPPKLTAAQGRIARRWLLDSPTEHGFDTELWTAPRLAAVIERELGVRLNRRYLAAWLRAHGLTPQRPQRVPRERSQQALANWLARDWPRIKKKRAAGRPGSC